MSKGTIKSFCASVLPANYQQVGHHVQRCQAALDSWLPERLLGMLQVLTVNSGTVSVAATSPVVANYLRLHHAAMQTVLAEVLKQECKVEVKTRPASLAEVPLPQRPPPPKALRPATISSLESSANAIEDDSLREAMRSLAQTLAAASKDKPR